MGVFFSAEALHLYLSNSNFRISYFAEYTMFCTVKNITYQITYYKLHHRVEHRMWGSFSHVHKLISSFVRVMILQ